MDKSTNAILTSILLLASTSVFATSYTVTGTAPGSGDFGANVFHVGPDIVANIVSISGTYDDVTNQLSLTLEVDPIDPGFGSNFFASFTGTSGWDFDANADDFLDVMSTADVGAPAGNPVITAQFTFTPGDQCCSGGVIDPNSFTPVNDHFLLTLWGQSTAPIINTASGLAHLGVDIRAKLEPVPLPAAILFFATALAGLIRIRQRRISATV